MRAVSEISVSAHSIAFIFNFCVSLSLTLSPPSLSCEGLSLPPPSLGLSLPPPSLSFCISLFLSHLYIAALCALTVPALTFGRGGTCKSPPTARPGCRGTVKRGSIAHCREASAGREAAPRAGRCEASPLAGRGAGGGGGAGVQARLVVREDDVLLEKKLAAREVGKADLVRAAHAVLVPDVDSDLTVEVAAAQPAGPVTGLRNGPRRFGTGRLSTPLVFVRSPTYSWRLMRCCFHSGFRFC